MMAGIRWCRVLTVAVAALAWTAASSPGGDNAPPVAEAAQTGKAADDASPADRSAAAPAPGPASGGVRSIQLQPGDDASVPVDPMRARTEADERRLRALAHFMAGELYLERGGDEEVSRGLRELERAIDLNPSAIEPYRIYLPAIVQRRDDDKARKYALLATEHHAGGVQLVRALTAVYLQQGQHAPAIAVLRAALELPTLKPRTFGRLILQRHLGQVLSLDKQAEPAAEAYRALLADLKPERPALPDQEGKQLYGERGELYEDMGSAFLAAQLPELAVEAFDLSAQVAQRSPGVHSFHLAQVFRQTGKPDRALEELEKYFAAQLSEKGRAPYQLLKELLAELKRDGELLDRLRKLAEVDGRNKFLQHFLASELVLADDLDGAEKIYSSIGGKSDPEALVGLASIYRRQGKYAQWLKEAGRIFSILQLGNEQVRERLSDEFKNLGDRFTADADDIAKHPEQLTGILKLGREQSQGDNPELEFEQAWLLGRIAAQGKQADDAAHFYRYAIGMQNIPSYTLYQELGAFFVDEKRYRDAEQVFQEAADAPALEVIRFYFVSMVSIAREMDGRIDAALEAIAEARRLRPDRSALAVQEARIYYRARRWEEAIAAFNGVIREFAGEEELVRDCRFSLSAIHVAKGDFAAGEQILLEILEQHPDHPQANNDLGYLWADRNMHLPRAREMIEKALKAEPDNAAYLDSLGWVLYRLGEPAEAVKHLETAAGMPRGADPTIQDHLGDCYDKLGQADKARAAWQKALEMESEKSFPDPKLVDALRRKLATPAAGDPPAAAAAPQETPKPDATQPPE